MANIGNMQGIRVAGHFGEWLQGRLGPEGPVVLVTLRCSALSAGLPGTVAPLPRDVLQRFQKALGLPSSESPGFALDMPPGGGAGASTACLVAWALAQGFDGTTEALARACVEAEGASDPLMWPAPDRLVWASREGSVIRQLPAPPRCQVVGGFWGRPERTRAEDQSFADIGDLLLAWAEAVQEGDLHRCAELASTSAERCHSTRGGKGPLPDLVKDLGALGHVRAHTGSARGLLFAPDAAPRHTQEILTEAGLTGVLRFETGGA